MQFTLVVFLLVLRILPIAGSLDLLGIAIVEYLAVCGVMIIVFLVIPAVEV
jgi:hypothetical protein